MPSIVDYKRFKSQMSKLNIYKIVIGCFIPSSVISSKYNETSQLEFRLL